MKGKSPPADPDQAASFSIAWPVFDSYTHCAGSAGVPADVLRSAKAAGSPGFKHGRIYFGEFIRWYFANSKEVGKGLNYERERLLREQADELARENALAEKRLYTLEAVEDKLWLKGLARVREAWTQYPKTTGLKLRSILAAAGVASDVIERAVSEAVDGVTEPLARLRESLPKKKD